MIKKILAGMVVFLAILSLIWGVFLPWQMAKNYISSMRLAGENQVSLEKFVNLFEVVLKFPSPVGKEEVTKFLSNDIKSMVATQEERVAKSLVGFMNQYLFTDEVRHLLTRAEIHYTLWRRFGEREDFIKAAEAYQEAGKIGPNLPQPIYGLYNLFLESGQQDLTERAGKEILRLWPMETRIKLGN
jgi:hypothetical protein